MVGLQSGPQTNERINNGNIKRNFLAPHLAVYVGNSCSSVIKFPLFPNLRLTFMSMISLQFSTKVCCFSCYLERNFLEYNCPFLLWPLENCPSTFFCFSIRRKTSWKISPNNHHKENRSNSISIINYWTLFIAKQNTKTPKFQNLQELIWAQWSCVKLSEQTVWFWPSGIERNEIE